jgi:hypothetical protein
MVEFQVWKQRREELMREAHQARLANALRYSRKRHGAGPTSSLVWELRWGAGRLLKLLRPRRKTG